MHVESCEQPISKGKPRGYFYGKKTQVVASQCYECKAPFNSMVHSYSSRLVPFSCCVQKGKMILCSQVWWAFVFRIPMQPSALQGIWSSRDQVCWESNQFKTTRPHERTQSYMCLRRWACDCSACTTFPSWMFPGPVPCLPESTTRVKLRLERLS